MVDEETCRKLREMAASEMVDTLDLQDADQTCAAMAFYKRVHMVVDQRKEAGRARACASRIPRCAG